MAEIHSALADHLAPRRLGSGGGDAPVQLSERPIAALWQVAAWPGGLAAAGKAAAKAAGAKAAPGPGRAEAGSRALLLRTEPLRWLLLSDEPLEAPALKAEEGAVLDLSHARTRMRLEGPGAIDVLARLMPLDLRPAAFPDGSVAATGLHHVMANVISRDGGFEVLVMRSYALSVWELLLTATARLGGEVA